MPDIRIVPVLSTSCKRVVTKRNPPKHFARRRIYPRRPFVKFNGKVYPPHFHINMWGYHSVAFSRKDAAIDTRRIRIKIKPINIRFSKLWLAKTYML